MADPDTGWMSGSLFIFFETAMSRQDIYVNAQYGEMETTGQQTNKLLFGFNYLGEIPGMDNENCCYGEVSVPEGFEKKYKEGEGIYTQIPYLPVYKRLLVRFSMTGNNGSLEYLVNRANNRIWFSICRESEVDDEKHIRLSGFRLLCEDGFFYLVFQGERLFIYSGYQTDFIIKAALKQNEVFLLKTFAGNLYQHPTTGVGLVDFLHGNLENTGLAVKLQKEFENDNMIIEDAYMDSDSGELMMNVKEK